MAPRNETVVITGSSGFIGRALVDKLAPRFQVVGLDITGPPQLPPNASFVPIDLTTEDGVRDALQQVREQHGGRIASVIHLAAYFDLTGEPNAKYEEVTVRGTERLLRALQDFEVEQFVFSSSMLVHAAGRPGERIDEERPLDPKLPYRASKIETERLIQAQRGRIPVVLLRPAGVYDDLCHSPFIARQITRIYERSPRAHVYPGDLRTGQSFIHLEDLTNAMVRLVERRADLPAELPLLLGEPDVMSYDELQQEIGRLVHGEEWQTWQVPKALAKTGAWLEDEVLGEEPFIRPWMVDIADDHYALDIGRAQTLLGWQPKHSLRDILPKMIAALKADPPGWYRANKLNAARVSMARVQSEAPPDEREMRTHVNEMREMHLGTLWVHFLNIALGLWLITSPFAFGLFDPETAQHVVRDITAERGLPSPVLRNTLVGISDIVSGVLIVAFGALSLSQRFAWAQWANTCVGIWLLFAPLIFWAPTAAAYANDTIVGALVIAFAILVPMMPGMSHEGMMDEADVPPGWTYSPSTYLQRLPIITLGLIGFLIARQLSAYQMGHTGGVWEPFFSGEGGLNGTETIITSDVSKAWPIADGGLGAVSYMFEVLMGVMGDRRRWRTMPWMVVLFGIVVVPLGVVSIYFIIIQPIVIGTYCTLCLLAALAMLIMIPFALDELVAMGQFVLHSHRAGKPFWRTFFQGGAMPGSTEGERPGFGSDLRTTWAAMAWGVTVPWTLVVSAALGVWLMFSRLIFGTEPPMADSDHLIGALIITVAVSAMAEVARPLRFINVLFGLWLIIAPWLLSGATTLGVWAAIVVGVALIGLSLPRGRRSSEHYGSWDRYVV
jgi:nucleoside-diphosphate-sugar epimerase/uncharacterized membrane protein